MLLLDVENRGTIDAPDLRLTLARGSSPSGRIAHSRGHPSWHDLRDAAARVAIDILGLDLDPDPAQRRAEAEPALSRTAIALRGLRPPRYPDLFETIANVIPFQQVSLEAGMAVVEKLVRRFGEGLTIDEQRFSLFPSAEVVADARILSLRRCGMSERKSQALRAAARAIACGELTAAQIATLPSIAAIEALMQHSGIGPWSAALILLRGFRRLDVFPQADTGAESALAALMRLRSSASLARIVERFGEYRGYLYFYGLASRLLSAGLIHAAPVLTRATRTARRGYRRSAMRSIASTPATQIAKHDR